MCARVEVGGRCAFFFFRPDSASFFRSERGCLRVRVCVRGCVWHVGVESGGGVGWCRCGEGGSRRLDGEPSLACRFFVRCRRRRAVGGGEGGVRTGKWPQRALGGVGRRGARERKSAKGRGGGEESERGFGVRCVWGESERASGVRALLLGRRSFWFCGVVQGGVRWKGARFAFVRRRRYHSVCRSEESSVGRK